MKRRIGRVVRWGALAGLLVVGSITARGETVAEEMERATSLMERGQYTLAVEALDGILEQDPDNAEATAMREQALELEAEAETSSRVSQLLAEAQAYASGGNTARAQQRLKALLELDPEHAEARELLSEIELESEMDLLMEEAEGHKAAEGDFVDMDEVDVPPTVVRTRAATYPAVAQRMGIEGSARFLATVGIDGKVEDVRIIRKIEGWDGLNRNAEKAVRRYEFTPAEKDGVKVKTIVNVTVDFRVSR